MSYGKIIETTTGKETYVLAEKTEVEGTGDPAIMVSIAGVDLPLYETEELTFVSACGRWRFVGWEVPFKEQLGDGVEISALRPLRSLKTAEVAAPEPPRKAEPERCLRCGNVQGEGSPWCSTCRGG